MFSKSQPISEEMVDRNLKACTFLFLYNPSKKKFFFVTMEAALTLLQFHTGATPTQKPTTVQKPTQKPVQSTPTQKARFVHDGLKRVHIDVFLSRVSALHYHGYNALDLCNAGYPKLYILCLHKMRRQQPATLKKKYELVPFLKVAGCCRRIL